MGGRRDVARLDAGGLPRGVPTGEHAAMNAPTALETIALESGSSRVLVAPSRGAIITRLSVGDRQVLYLDESTLLDPSKNVRGGIPVLFPSPGRLEATASRGSVARAATGSRLTRVRVATAP